MGKLIDPRAFDNAVRKLRAFFHCRGFIEAHTQSGLSILAACEDPRTIGTFNYAGQVWPLPQTGQMWLEELLLKNSKVPGFFCLSTSFRNEPRPVAGRHDLIFPMFEFETHGDITDLENLEKDLLDWLGFERSVTPSFLYTDAAQIYKTQELNWEHEQQMEKDYGPVVFLTHFPTYTSPFWNMKQTDNFAHKIDVILYGIETIGSAERSCNPQQMRESFYTISDGMYAEILFSQFTRERVERELSAFLSLPFFPRCGGGIGMTRLIRALNLLEQDKK